ncbi:hypothetical protein [Clostridioides sp. ES-S-0010-02]|uniref:hypothetical protein n=1 Tax=Clostridioides sp. ES-S-0010-02 TaxID=2770776 RepID=UPI001D1230E1|nr:hypothetical protein JJC01_03795 [Clostridioides sp. ES-S-0010-02]
MVSNEYDKIKTAISNIKIDEYFIKDVIFLLSNYITKSNDNYLYNSTYLTSYTDEFIQFLNMFLKKQQIVENIKSYMNKEVKHNDLHVKIDLTWEIINRETIITNISSNRIVDDRLYVEIIRKDVSVIGFYYIKDTIEGELKCSIEDFIKNYCLEGDSYETECALSQVD